MGFAWFLHLAPALLDGKREPKSVLPLTTHDVTLTLRWERSAMQPIENRGPVRQTAGVIQDVDVMARELTVCCNRTTYVFDVPPACSILLEGESVKLRLLLPEDYAQISYRRVEDRLVACSIRVSWRRPRTQDERQLHEGLAGTQPIRAPFDLPEPDQPAATDAELRAPARNPGILIADGMGLILILLKVEFEPLGFNIWLAQDGEEAIRLYRQHRGGIDVVLLSARLAGRDALQTLTALRRINPEVCVCFLTDSRAKYTHNDLLVRGAASVLPKQVRPAQVAHAVQDLVNNRQPTSTCARPQRG
jgi:CheY-like chemotaxis protein